MVRRRGAAQACAALVLTLLIVGCTRSEAPRTVEDYRANKAERAAKVRECSADPGRLEGTPNCVNALRAESLESIGSFRDLSPLDLPTHPARKTSPQ